MTQNNSIFNFPPIVDEIMRHANNQETLSPEELAIWKGRRQKDAELCWQQSLNEQQSLKRLIAGADTAGSVGGSLKV